MDNLQNTHCKFRRMFLNILSIAVMMAMAFPTSMVAAATGSPFLGQWRAIDVDGSDIRLSIAGRPDGPFQITWTENYLSFCNGKAGIVRGMGWLVEGNSNLLEADLRVQCFTTDAELDLHMVWRYHPATNTLSNRYDNGVVTIWRRPGGGQTEEPPALGLRVNYGHDWVESFYEGGHTAWISVTDSDGNLKATAELVTEPKSYWGDETGFQSLDGVWFNADGNQMENPPDLLPNDWVYGWVDSGASAQVQIGDIRGEIDLLNDSIGGTIYAPWFTDAVQVECLDWGSGQEPPFDNQDAGFKLTNGEDPYSCSWEGWDIQPYQNVGVAYSGSDGHWVANAFYARNPRIVVSEAGNWFWTTDFNPGTLNLFIYESADDGAPLLWSGSSEADQSGFTIVGYDVHGQDLVPGNYLVISDGESEKGVVLEKITMEVFDTEKEIMAGTAPAGRDVTVVAGMAEAETQATIFLTSDPGSGAWLADFSTIPFDITEDMRPWSFAQIFDEDGDANEAGTPPPPNPRIVASITEDWFYVNEFAPNTELNFMVYASQGGTLLWEGTTAATDGSGFVWVDAEGRWDLEPGNYVRVSDGTVTKDLVIEGFTFDIFDLTQGTLQGTVPGSEGRRVWVGIGFEDHGWSTDVFTDVSGNWSADYGSPITSGYAWVAAQIFDEDGDASELRPSQVINWTLNVTSNEDVLANDGACTLREAVIAANTNQPSGEMEGECPAGTYFQTDTILLAADQTYSLTIDSTCEDDQRCGDLDIWDNAAETDLIILVDGNSSATISQDAVVDDRVLENHGATAEVEGLTLTGGTTGWSGGGLLNSGSMIVNRSTITANSSPNDGGGGIANDGSLTLMSSTVSNNTSVHDGGGMTNTGTLVINASVLSGNSGAGGGALANLPGGNATVRNTEVYGNSSGTGALFNYGTMSVIESAVFQNTADYGGGLSNWGGTLTITNSTVSDNSASASAGGIHNKDGGITTIEDGSVISGNTAVFDGGGINNWDGEVFINNSTVSGNSAVQTGGGILNSPSGKITLNGATVAGNTAEGGGGLGNWGGVVSLSGSIVDNNTAAFGGGMFTVGGSLTLDSTTVSNNTATAGDGGLQIKDGAVVMIQAGSVISGNKAPNGYGGGISNWSSTLTIDASSVTGNSAAVSAGGALNKDGGSTTIQNGSIISGNMATYDGGISNWDGSTMTIKGSTIVENVASSTSGGIGNLGTMTIQDSTISGNSAPVGGGVFNRSMLTITGTVISDNEASNAGGGILNVKAPLSVSGSVLRGNTAAQGGAFYNYTDSDYPIAITDSCIVGNSDVAFFNESSYMLMATYNWWGDASGPSGVGSGLGDSVSDLIDFSNWLTEPPSVCIP